MARDVSVEFLGDESFPVRVAPGDTPHENHPSELLFTRVLVPADGAPGTPAGSPRRLISI